MGKEGSGSFWMNADFRVLRGDLPLLAEGRRAVRSPHLKFLNFAKFYKIRTIWGKKERRSRATLSDDTSAALF